MVMRKFIIFACMALVSIITVSQSPVADESARFLSAVDSIVENSLADGMFKEYIDDRVGQLTIEIISEDLASHELDVMTEYGSYLISVQTGYAPNRKQRYVYQGAHRAYLSANNIVSFKELPAKAKVDAADNSRYVVQWSFFFEHDKMRSATLTVAEKTGFQRTVRFKNLLSK